MSHADKFEPQPEGTPNTVKHTCSRCGHSALYLAYHEARGWGYVMLAKPFQQHYPDTTAYVCPECMKEARLWLTTS